MSATATMEDTMERRVTWLVDVLTDRDPDAYPRARLALSRWAGPVGRPRRYVVRECRSLLRRYRQRWQALATGRPDPHADGPTYLGLGDLAFLAGCLRKALANDSNV